MTPTRPLSPLLLSEAATAGRRYDGAISVPDLAWAMQCTQTRARQITKAMVAAGRWDAHAAARAFAHQETT